MYSFTKVKVSVGRSKAEVDMRCAYCFDGNELLGIKAQQDYFFIQGCRTYERINDRRDFGSTPLEDEFVPYVPYLLRQKLVNPMHPARFREIISQHKMCMDCYKKLYGFFGSELRFPTSIGMRTETSTRHTMRLYQSHPKREYKCQCCGQHIPGDTLYGRNGLSGIVCHGCFKLLSRYIGKEFSD